MRSAYAISALDWLDAPGDLAARWPSDQPLLWLHSGRLHERWARWSIMATPRAVWRVDASSRSQWVGEVPVELREVRFTHDPTRDLDAVLRATAIDDRASLKPGFRFHGGWIGFISYDLGRVIEPRAIHETRSRDHGWPLVELAWCPDTLAFDHVESRWHSIGLPPKCALGHDNSSPCSLGVLAPELPRAAYEGMVARTIDYITAGDVFQANIAQRLGTRFHGSTRALALAAFEHARPWYGVYLELGEANRRLLSLSPELFLHVDPATRRVTTRPIKGTRPISCDPRELRDSIKDKAELNMIVDLMRNDLGRVCAYGSVHAPQPRVIETHPTVHHGVAEVTGILREGTSVGDLLRATFPPGSVTGAPKIRAMQIIDELETAALGNRGPYCGAIGFISDCGAITLNVAIRTMLLEGAADVHRCDVLRDGRAAYWAGAGIVADSTPTRELQETLDKVAVVRGLRDGRVRGNPGRREPCRESVR